VLLQCPRPSGRAVCVYMIVCSPLSPPASSCARASKGGGAGRCPRRQGGRDGGLEGRRRCRCVGVLACDVHAAHLLPWHVVCSHATGLRVSPGRARTEWDGGGGVARYVV
jgi:hypothetical protein